MPVTSYYYSVNVSGRACDMPGTSYSYSLWNFLKCFWTCVCMWLLDAKAARDAKAMATPAMATPAMATPAMATPADVKEYRNSYVFVIDMPDLKSEDIKVQVEEDNVLIVSCERKREEEKEGVKYLRMERRVGKFMRKFTLPDNANTDAISAVYQDGVLIVTVNKLPPPEPKKPKIIEVKIG